MTVFLAGQSSLTNKNTQETKAALKNLQKERQTRQEQISVLSVKEGIYTLDKTVCSQGHLLKAIGKNFVDDKLHFQSAKFKVEKICQ